METLAECLPALALAIALAASAGLRAWLPLPLAGALARLGVLDLGPSFQFLEHSRHSGREREQALQIAEVHKRPTA